MPLKNTALSGKTRLDRHFDLIRELFSSAAYARKVSEALDERTFSMEAEAKKTEGGVLQTPPPPPLRPAC